MKRSQKGWVALQERTGSFSGLSVRDLARTFKLDQIYLTVYRRQSDIVHGSNGMDFLQLSPNGLQLDLAPNPDDVNLVLRLGSALMIGMADVMNERFGLGLTKRIKALTRASKNNKLI